MGFNDITIQLVNGSYTFDGSQKIFKFDVNYSVQNESSVPNETQIELQVQFMLLLLFEIYTTSSNVLRIVAVKAKLLLG